MPPPESTVAAFSICVFLMIENRLLREALSRLLRKYSDILVVGQSGQVDPSPRPALDRRCDVLITDSAEFTGRAQSSAVESIRQIAFNIIFIGMGADEEQFIAAIRSGATGYLLQDASFFRSCCCCPCRLSWRGRLSFPTLLRPIPFRGSKRQRDASPKLNFKAGTYLAPAAIGRSGVQRAHKQGNRFPLESF